MKRSFIALVIAMVVFVAMTSAQKNEKPMESETRTIVRLETTKGDIEIALYNETPGHRDNFVKNVEAGAYDGVIFHRVINDFMIQTGDPKSKEAVKGQMYGSSDFGSEIPAEFVYPKFFHKKGSAGYLQNRNDDSRHDHSCTKQLVTDIFFLKNKLACQDGDHTAALLDQRHHRNSASFHSVCNEQCSVRYHKQDTEKPDPAIFEDTSADPRPCDNQIYSVIGHKEQHIPELQLRAADLTHQKFIHKTRYRIQDTGGKGKQNIDYLNILLLPVSCRARSEL